MLEYSVMSSDENNVVSSYLAANPMLLQHHEDWHEQNPFPWPPGSQDRRPPGFQNPWPGRDPDYGSEFFNMHRHMISEFNTWRRTNRIAEVTSWDPAKPIPTDIFHPGRNTSNPKHPLPSWFKELGGRRREPATGNKKLGDFVDENLLGSVIAWWHNVVHSTIGGDMGDPSRAPIDPVFWRFHKFIDDTYSKWESLQT